MNLNKSHDLGIFRSQNERKYHKWTHLPSVRFSLMVAIASIFLPSSPFTKSPTLNHSLATPLFPLITNNDVVNFQSIDDCNSTTCCTDRIRKRNVESDDERMKKEIKNDIENTKRFQNWIEMWIESVVHVTY